MKTRRERMADIMEKIGLVFVAAAYLQAKQADVAVLYFVMAVVALVVSIVLSGAGRSRS